MNLDNSCYIIYNKTNNILNFTDFIKEFPSISIIQQAKENINNILNNAKMIQLYPGENYIEPIDEIIIKGETKSINFEWKELYSEQEY